MTGTSKQSFKKKKSFKDELTRTSQLLQKGPQLAADTTNPQKWIKWIKARCEVCRKEMKAGRQGPLHFFPQIIFNKNSCQILLFPVFLLPPWLHLVHFTVTCHSVQALLIPLFYYLWSPGIFTFTCCKKLRLHMPLYSAILLLGIFPTYANSHIYAHWDTHRDVHMAVLIVTVKKEEPYKIH